MFIALKSRVPRSEVAFVEAVQELLAAVRELPGATQEFHENSEVKLRVVAALDSEVNLSETELKRVVSDVEHNYNCIANFLLDFEEAEADKRELYGSLLKARCEYSQYLKEDYDIKEVEEDKYPTSRHGMFTVSKDQLTNAEGVVPDDARPILEAHLMETFGVLCNTFGLKAKLVKHLVVEEPYADGTLHLHAGLSFSVQFSHFLYWSTLLAQKGIKGRFTFHPSYAITLKYLCVPSYKKPYSHIDRNPLFSEGHGPIWKAMAAAFQTARACAVKRPAGDDLKGAAIKTPKVKPKEPGAFEMGVNMIRGEKITSPKILMFRARQLSEQENPSWKLFKYLYDPKNPKGSKKAKSLVEFVWKAQVIEDDIEREGMTRMQILEKACDMDCVCGGLWGSLADGVCDRNGIDRIDLQYSMVLALTDDDGKLDRQNVVFLIGDTTSGKSFLLKPFNHIYICYPKPPCNATFPLTGPLASFQRNNFPMG
jgi:hypothetical protein